MSKITRVFSLAGLAFVLVSAGCVRAKKGPSDDDIKRLAPNILTEMPAGVTAPLAIDFDGKAHLLGYSVSPTAPKAGESVSLTMYWKCDAKFDRGWKLFSHLLPVAGGDPIGNLDAAGPLREAVGDHQIMGPEFWEVGKVYADEVKFDMPDAAGGVQLVSGLWRGDDRVKVTAGKQTGDNRAIVWTSRAVPASLPTLSITKLDSGLIVSATKKSAITVDGKDDEAEWASAAATGPFVNVGTGAANTAASGGSAKVLWDATNLYVFFRVQDTSISGKEFEGDKKPETHTAVGQPKLWTKDTVEVMIDPDGDGDSADYYEIQVSPNNLQFHSQFDTKQMPSGGENGPFGHEDWAANIKSATLVQGALGKASDSADGDVGYTVEMAIPWASMSKAKRHPPANGDTWRMNFYAMENNGGVAWSPILGQGNFHTAQRFGRVTFLDPMPAASADAGPEAAAKTRDAGSRSAAALDAGAEPPALFPRNGAVRLRPGVMPSLPGKGVVP